MIINNHIHHSNGTHFNHIVGTIPQLLLALPFILALIMYILAVVVSNKRYKPWPIHRTFCWALSVFFAIFSVVGPLVNRAHLDFTAHMLDHLFLGMLAPLLLVLAAPMTLTIRTLSVPLARRLSKVLRSWLFRILTNPVVASILNIGGLWILYTTNLYSFMHQSILVHLIVHFHIFFAGYLFTVSMIYIDPVPHRISFLTRTIVLVAAFAGHGILSKYIYAHSPNGVPIDQAELGGMLMYYGGDIIDIVMIFILCLHWFRATRPRIRLAINQ